MTTTIPYGQNPASPEDIQNLGHLFMLNWDQGFSLESSYTTHVQSSYTASEQRWGIQDRPRRSVSVRLTAFNAQELFSLNAYIKRIARSRHLIPLPCDQSFLTLGASAGASAVSCETLRRRFAPGHLVAIGKPRANKVSTFEVKEIATVTMGGLTFTTPLVNALQKGDWVAPLMVCDPVLSTAAASLSDTTGQVEFSAIESAGPTQLPGVVPIGDIPSGFLSAFRPDSTEPLPIFPLAPDFAQGNLSWGSSQDYAEEVSGFASSFDIIGSRSRNTFSFNIPCLSKEASWDAIRFFDSRGGRLLPFWVLSPLTQISEPEIINDHEIRVPSVVHLSDWDTYPHLGIVLKDGQTFVRRFAVSREDGKDILAFDPVPGLEEGSLSRVCFAWMCRLTNDSLTEEWRTDHVLVSSFTVQEVLDESPKNLAGLKMPATMPAALPWNPLICSGDLPPMDPVPEGLFYAVIPAYRQCDEESWCYDKELHVPSICQGEYSLFYVSVESLLAFGLTTADLDDPDKRVYLQFSFPPADYRVLDLRNTALETGCYRIPPGGHALEALPDDPLARDLSEYLTDAYLKESGCGSRAEDGTCGPEPGVVLPLWIPLESCDDDDEEILYIAAENAFIEGQGYLFPGLTVRLYDEDGPCYTAGAYTPEQPVDELSAGSLYAFLSDCNECDPADCCQVGTGSQPKGGFDKTHENRLTKFSYMLVEQVTAYNRTDCESQCDSFPWTEDVYSLKWEYIAADDGLLPGGFDQGPNFTECLKWDGNEGATVKVYESNVSGIPDKNNPAHWNLIDEYGVSSIRYSPQHGWVLNFQFPGAVHTIVFCRFGGRVEDCVETPYCNQDDPPHDPCECGEPGCTCFVEMFRQIYDLEVEWDDNGKCKHLWEDQPEYCEDS